MATKHLTISTTKCIKYVNSLSIIKRYCSNRSYSSLGVVIDSEVSHYDDKLVKSYDEIPGPKGLPFVGNTWRFAPFVGMFEFSLKLHCF